MTRRRGCPSPCHCFCRRGSWRALGFAVASKETKEVVGGQMWTGEMDRPIEVALISKAPEYVAIVILEYSKMDIFLKNEA